MIRKKKQQIVLIVGSGVIGAYLSKFLLKKGIKIIVTTRKLKGYAKNYKKLKINNKVKFVKLNLLNKNKIKKIILKFNPALIYYFAGQRSVPKSFKNPKNTYFSNYLGAEKFLSILKEENLKIKFFKANSAYIFNGKGKKISIKSDLIKPESPYTNSQIKAFNLIKKYRNLGLKCYSIIFFNIESPLSPIDYIAKKICFLAKKIKNKKINHITVGNINTVRDFGWAPEMVKAVYLMKNLKPQDMLVGTGVSMTIKKLIYYAFNYHNLNYKNYIKVDKKLYRKHERIKIVGSMTKTFRLLNKWKWKPKITGEKFVTTMCNNF